MQRQNLTNVCSVMHISGLGTARSVEDFRQALFDIGKEDWRHQLMVVGPNQKIAKEGLREMRLKYPKRLKLCVSLNTGHGGKTEVWLVLRRFRDQEPSEAFLADDK